MKRIFLVFITFTLVMAAIGCSLITKQTAPITSQKRTSALLDIHSSIAPKIPFNMNTDKIIMFSDLHRGMGEKDVFKNNRELFQQILEYYNERKYTLVLIGDCEEGWGFQRDNIPLILKAHYNEFEIEKGFQADNRYYRVYGNHDDFFRGQLINFEELGLKKVYPAIFFNDEKNGFNIFITHGSQGHGLHDAGDELAAWGVYVKYYWFLEIFSKKFKSEKDLEKKIQAIKKDLENHEKMLYQWALKDNYSKKKICNILVAGHTHIPVFNSRPKDKDCMYEVIKNDLETGKYMFFNDIFERKPTSGALYTSSDADTMEIPDSFNKKMIKYLGDQIKNNVQNEDRFAVSEGEETDPFYFNTGCGFHSKITCIEINEGKISLKLLWLNENRELTEEIVETADLEIYKRKMEKYGNMGKKTPGKK